MILFIENIVVHCVVVLTFFKCQLVISIFIKSTDLIKRSNCLGMVWRASFNCYLQMEFYNNKFISQL